MEKNNSTIQKSGLGARASRRLANTIIYIVLIAMTIVWLFPFFGIVMESFKVNTRGMDGELFPEKFGFDNYIRLFKDTDFLKTARFISPQAPISTGIPRLGSRNLTLESVPHFTAI